MIIMEIIHLIVVGLLISIMVLTAHKMDKCFKNLKELQKELLKGSKNENKSRTV